MLIFKISFLRKSQPADKSPNPLALILILLLQPKTAPEESRFPIFVALERGLNVSLKANIQPAGIESQI